MKEMRIQEGSDGAELRREREYPVEKLDRADGECMEQPSWSECHFPQAENGLGREMELGRPLSKGFRLRVWVKEAVNFREMCPISLLHCGLAGSPLTRRGHVNPTLWHRAVTVCCLIKVFMMDLWEWSSSCFIQSYQLNIKQEQL